jgi:hypothetical protein
MKNRTVPLVVLIVMILLAIFLTSRYHDKYFTAWKESPNSSLGKYSAIALSVGFTIASIAIFSALAYLNGGYSIFIGADFGFWPFANRLNAFWPFLLPAVATIIVSTILMWLIYPFSGFLDKFNTAKVGTVVTTIVEVLFLWGQYCWIKEEIDERNEIEEY